jgi:V/A-type H+-transporting ATPase subunit A
MMQLLTRFIELSEQAIGQKVAFELISSLPILRRLRRMNEDIGEQDVEQFEVLRSDMENAFSALKKQGTADAG